MEKGIFLCFVFDGKPPELKFQTQQARRARKEKQSKKSKKRASKRAKQMKKKNDDKNDDDNKDDDKRDAAKKNKHAASRPRLAVAAPGANATAATERMRAKSLHRQVPSDA